MGAMMAGFTHQCDTSLVELVSYGSQLSLKAETNVAVNLQSRLLQPAVSFTAIRYDNVPSVQLKAVAFRLARHLE